MNNNINNKTSSDALEAAMSKEDKDTIRTILYSLQLCFSDRSQALKYYADFFKSLRLVRKRQVGANSGILRGE